MPFTASSVRPRGLPSADSGSTEPNVDVGVVTLADGAAAAAVDDVAERFVEAIAQHRHWSREQDRVPA
jgi:hypothetical protein